MADRIIHVEVVGRDAGKLQKFFSDLFGWKLDTNNPGGYGMASSDDNGIVTGIGSTPDGSAGHVTFYVSVADIDKAIEKATRLGGRVIMPKMSPGGGATIALIADPEGHVVGLTQA
ncbi:MAG TPA: VOC family protein [Candidatus Limnocylindrales bacterium]